MPPGRDIPENLMERPCANGLQLISSNFSHTGARSECPWLSEGSSALDGLQQAEKPSRLSLVFTQEEGCLIHSPAPLPFHLSLSKSGFHQLPLGRSFSKFSSSYLHKSLCLPRPPLPPPPPHTHRGMKGARRARGGGGSGMDLFVITVVFSLPTRPTVLSIHRLRPGLAPRSPSCPVFMSLRRGQYFSVEPSHRDPLYKTLTKNRRSNPCPAPSPPPRLPHACPQRSSTQLQFAGRQACQIGQISQLWGPGELLSSPGVLK